MSKSSDLEVDFQVVCEVYLKGQKLGTIIKAEFYEGSTLTDVAYGYKEGGRSYFVKTWTTPGMVLEHLLK